MAGTQFEWQADQDQTYTADLGSQTIFQPSFNKACGKSFRMQTPGQQLKLVVPNSAHESDWGGNCTGLPTTIFLENGTLQYGEAPSTLAGTLTIASTDIILQNASRLALNVNDYNGGIFLGGVSTLVNRLNLGDASSVDINCGMTFRSSDSVQIEGASHMTVTSPMIDLNHCAIAVSSRLPMDRASLSLTVPDQEPFFYARATNAVLTCNASSKTVIRVAPKVTLMFTGSTIMGTGESRLEIHADDIQFAERDNTQFQAYDSCALVFEGATPDSAPFDFIKKTYPPGLFQFFQEIPGQKPTILIRKCGNAYSFSAMLQQRLIYIQGQPVTNEKQLVHEYVNSDLVLQPK